LCARRGQNLHDNKKGGFQTWSKENGLNWSLKKPVSPFEEGHSTREEWPDFNVERKTWGKRETQEGILLWGGGGKKPHLFNRSKKKKKAFWQKGRPSSTKGGKGPHV